MKPFPCEPGSCQPFRPVIRSNPDVAGIGVIASFVAAAWLSVAFAIAVTLLDWLKPSLVRVRAALEETLLTLSDMQLVTGLATLVASFIEVCRMTTYHYNIVIHMVMISTVTHTLTVTVLAGFFRRNWKLFAVRLAFVTCVFLMWIVFAIEGVSLPVYYAGISLRACCYWTKWPQLDFGVVHDQGNGTFVFHNGTRMTQGAAVAESDVHFSGSSRTLIRITLIFAAPASFLLSITSISPAFRRLFDNRTFLLAGFLIPYGWIFRSVICLVVFPLLFASWGTYFVFAERAYLRKKDNTHLRMSDNAEESWSFGQIMPILLLMLVVFTAAEGFAKDVSEAVETNNGLLKESRRVVPMG